MNKAHNHRAINNDSAASYNYTGFFPSTAWQLSPPDININCVYEARYM